MSFVDKKDATAYPLCRNGFKHIFLQVAVYRNLNGKASGKVGADCAPALPDAFHIFSLMICSYSKDGSGGMRLHYNADKQICTVGRAGLDKRFNEQVGEILDIPLERQLSSLRIFIDRSSVEFFVNNGEAVFTSHVYPTDRERHYSVSKNGSVKMWKFGASVVDDFVI